MERFHQRDCAGPPLSVWPKRPGQGMDADGPQGADAETPRHHLRSLSWIRNFASGSWNWGGKSAADRDARSRLQLLSAVCAPRHLGWRAERGFAEAVARGCLVQRHLWGFVPAGL